jgi:hypothetical protein
MNISDLANKNCLANTSSLISIICPESIIVGGTNAIYTMITNHSSIVWRIINPELNVPELANVHELLTLTL